MKTSENSLLAQELLTVLEVNAQNMHIIRMDAEQENLRGLSFYARNH